MNLNNAIRCCALFACATAFSRAEDVSINVDAGKIVGEPVSRYLTGACIEDVNHEIYGGIYSQMILGESFQEPALAPPINGFKAHSGGWLVRDGAVAINANDGPKLVSEHAPFADGAAGVELFFADRKGENAGLIVRVNKPGLGADRFAGYEISLDAAHQSLRLARHVNNYELIKDVKCDVATGRWISLETRLTGSTIEILVDGKSALTHDDGARALPAGAVGLRAWHRDVSFRKLFVKSGNKTETLAFEQAPAQPVSNMWRPVSKGGAKGTFALTTERPFAGTQSQTLTFESGDGEWGVENQGLHHWGMSWVGDKPYEGYVWIRAEKPTAFFVALESRDGAKVYAEKELVTASTEWQRLDFKLRSGDTDPSGRFAIKLKQPGSVTLGHAYVQPGEWGRFKGLPVRRDVADAIINQGVTILRYGGSMVNNAGYRWKKMIGPRDRRPPYDGLWYHYSSNGWGILDFMDFCEAAKIEYIPTFCLDETPQDMVDFIEYATGPASSQWGGKRAADGHAEPYRLRYIELGNEERVDEKYAAQFEALAKAIWSKHPDIVLVVGDFVYDNKIGDPSKITGAASRITSLAGQQRVLQIAKQHNRPVWFDLHIDSNGPGRSGSLNALPTFIDALEKLSDGAQFKVVVFELNAGNHSMRRALGNAIAIGSIIRDGRLPVCTSANGLQPDGQNDNGWDQGLVFLNPSKVWLQPPGYVTQMIAQNCLPVRIKCEVAGNSPLDVTATYRTEGKMLSLMVANPTDKPVPTQINLAGLALAKPEANVIELSGALDARNTAAQPTAIVPKNTLWTHAIKEGKCNYTFPAHSFTVLRME